MKRSVNRRSYLKSAGLLTGAGVTSLTGCLGGGGDGGGGTVTSGTPELADKLTFATTGGSYGEAIQTAYLDTFSDEFGVEVEYVQGAWNEMYQKLKTGGLEGIDLFENWSYNIWDGIQNELWQPYRRENLDHFDRIIDSFKPENLAHNASEDIYTIPGQYGAYGAVVNEDYLDPVQSWDDMFTEETKGKLGLPGYPVAMVYTVAFMEDLYPIQEDYDSKIDQIWERMGELNEWVTTWWGTGSEGVNLFANEEAVAGSHWIGRVRALAKDSGLPVTYTVPEEGIDGWLTNRPIPATLEDPKRYTAEKLMDWTLAEEPSKIFAENIEYAQPIKFDDPPDNLKNHPDIENADRIHIPDPAFTSEYQSTWSQKFDEVVRSG